MKKRNIFKNRIFYGAMFTVFIIATSISFLSSYEIFLSKKDTLTIIFNSMTNKNLEALNIDKNTVFTNPISYYGIYLNIIQILCCLFASTLAIKTVLEDKKYEMLISLRPVHKMNYLKRKIIINIGSLAINIFIIFIFMLFFIKIKFHNPTYNFLTIFNIFFSLLLSSICFYFINLVIATFLKDTRLITITSIFIVIAFSILKIIYDLTHFKLIAYVNPLCYFNISFVISNNHLQLDFLASFVILTFFSYSFTIYEYKSKEVS